MSAVAELPAICPNCSRPRTEDSKLSGHGWVRYNLVSPDVPLYGCGYCGHNVETVKEIVRQEGIVISTPLRPVKAKEAP